VKTKCYRRFILSFIFLSSFSLLSIIFSEHPIYLEKAYAQQQLQTHQVTPNAKLNCISYDSSTRQIFISCPSITTSTTGATTVSGPVTLTDIYNQLNNLNVLNKEQAKQEQQQSQPIQQQQKGEVWILKASLVINKGSSLTIDNKDTSWLKILTDEKTTPVNAIIVHGSLKIDNVKVTSWNPLTNSYAQSTNSSRDAGSDIVKCGSDCSSDIKSKLAHVGTPRPYISIEENATGSTNITNSEIAYLGYEGGYGVKSSGLHYAGGDNSVIKNNDIHHVYFGFYSAGIGNVLIENNKIHDSGHYGIDPHTGTHDMIIRNNTVYNNNGTGIICSLNCYNILYETNNVFNNNGAGVDFSRNTTHSIARGNFIHDQTNPIFLDESSNNEVYDNKILNSNTSGIILTDDSSGNKIYNNIIQNAKNGITIKNEKGENTVINNSVYSNQIINPLSKAIVANSNVTKTNGIGQSNKVF
jgi:mannuronan 5-epimerase